MPVRTPLAQLRRAQLRRAQLRRAQLRRARLGRVPPGGWTAVIWCAYTADSLRVYSGLPGMPRESSGLSLFASLVVAAAVAAAVAGSVLLRQAAAGHADTGQGYQPGSMPGLADVGRLAAATTAAGGSWPAGIPEARLMWSC